MSETELPDRFKGKRTDYTFFDGFRESSLGMKALYIVTLPGLLIPAMIEAHQYNVAKHNAKDARAHIAAAGTLNSPQATASGAPELAQETTRHRDALAQQTAMAAQAPRLQ